MEQVAGFKLTEYPPDGKGSMELDFEQKVLLYDRRGGFILNLVSEQSSSLNKDVLEMWIRRLETLGGSVLLERKSSSTSPEGNSNNVNDDDPDGPTAVSSAKPSFASDRRIIRLIIARIFADMLQKKYLTEKEGSQS